MSWDWDKLKENQQNRGDMPPNLNDFDFFKKINDFKWRGGSLAFVVILIAIVYFGSSMVYSVGWDEVGVVQRFGKYNRTEGPGLNFKLPRGIEKVTKVPKTRIYKEEFGLSQKQYESRSYSSDSKTSDVGLMLTGDLNVGVVPWIVQYRIKEPKNFLFKVANVQRLLIDMSEATMRLIVGDRSISEVISKREEMADEAKKMLQKEMDKAEAGIFIVTIEMKRTNVPDKVRPSFNEVNQAVQEKEKLIYEANAEYNKAVPAAKGEAERLIKGAIGYKLERVNEAEGDAAWFTSLYNEYAKAKDVTRKRLYLETVGEMLPKMGKKYIIDENQKNLIPLMNLSDIKGGVK